MLQIGMTPIEVIRARADVLGELTFDDQAHLYREFDASPRMAMHIADLLQYPDPVRVINLSALYAALNELEPHEFPESAGLWPVLRREVEMLPRAIERAVHEATKDLTLAQKIVLAEGMADGNVEFGMAGIEGMALGQWGAIIGSVIQVGGALAQTKIMGSIQEDIAADQAKLQLQLGQQKIAADKEMAEKRLAVEAALKAREIELGAETEIRKAEVATIAGIPAWIIPVLLLGGGLLVWLFIKFKK